MTNITFRPGDIADSYQIFAVFEETLADLVRRFGRGEPTSWQDPAAMERMWQERRPLYEHLARTATYFWVAEKEGLLIGFARSILRDGVLELTDFFVRPGDQSAGVGRELLARAFPTAAARRRIIIATLDSRAQARYLKSGVYPIFPIYYFSHTPHPVTVATDLAIEPVSASPRTLEILGQLDKAVLDHSRDDDHTWLLSDRQGYLYYRNGQPVGYGYLGLRNGPFALLNPGDFPAVLAHAESSAAAAGREHFGLEVPMVNKTVVDYLLGRGFQMDAFVAMFMVDAPFGQFDRYIVTSPPFFL